MNRLSHGITAIMLFSILMGLVVSFNEGIKDAYILPSEEEAFDQSSNTIDGLTIGDRLSNLVALNGLSAIAESFQTILSGTVGIGDLFGAALVALGGTILLLIGVFTAPFEIASILETYYSWIPPYALQGLLIVMVVYVLILWKRGSTQQGGL